MSRYNGTKINGRSEQINYVSLAQTEKYYKQYQSRKRIIEMRRGSVSSGLGYHILRRIFGKSKLEAMPKIQEQQKPDLSDFVEGE